MKYKSMIVAQASGSTGGCTFSHNRYGAYIRQRTTPVNTNSIYQQQKRATFAAAVAAWTALSDTNKLLWGSFALAVPRPDAFGQAQTVTGQNWFITIYALRAQAGGALPTAPPALQSMALLTGPSVAIVASTGLATITFTNTDLWASASLGALLCYSGHGVPASRTYGSGPFRYRGNIPGAVTPPTSPQTLAIGTTFPVAIAQRVFFKFRAIDPINRISASTIVSAVAT